MKRDALLARLPGLRTALNYRAAWLRQDIVAGIALAAMLIPVGIAYAAASGLPGISGLYATIVPLLAYATFGPSRILILGPDSSLAAVILAVVVPLSAGNPQRAVAIAGAMAVVTGLACIAAGIARLGFVTELLSKPIRYGYMNGIALTVLLDQTPKLMGFSAPGDGVFSKIAAIGSGVATGRINATASLIGLATLVFVFGLKRWKFIPAPLIAVALTTFVVEMLALGQRAGVATLGPLPRGMPALMLPMIGIADLAQVAVGGFAVALIAFADTSVLSRAYAARLKEKVDPNQEMIALGAANLASGLFQGFPISSSSSRTPVAEGAGARTQLTGVVGALAVALLLLTAPDLLRSLPSATLAAIVIASAVGLFEVRDLVRIYKLQRWEFWLSMVCFAGVAVFGAIPGIGFAIVIAVMEFLWDGWRPYSAILGRTVGVEGYHDVTRYPAAQQIAGLVLFRWDAPLFFANGEFFREQALRAAARAAQPVRWLVVASEPITSLDVTSADSVAELRAELAEQGVRLCFAELKDPVRDKFDRFGLTAVLGRDAFYPTIEAAASAFQGSATGTGRN